MTSMYSHILASSLDDWVEELSGDALIEYALVCRTEMLRASSQRGYPISTVLAAEVAYDRSLLKLCEAGRIAGSALGFAHPVDERARLEAALALAGTDLVALARRRRRP
jgi:hypothetical protein